MQSVGLHFGLSRQVSCLLFFASLSASIFTSRLASISLRVSSRLLFWPAYGLVRKLLLRLLGRQLTRPSHFQNCQLALRRVPQAPHSTLLFLTACGGVAKTVLTTAWASTLLSVLPAH